MKKRIIFLFIFSLIGMLIYISIKSSFVFFSDKYFKYFLVIIFFLFLFIFLIFLSEKIQEIFLIIFISIIVTIYAIEISMPLYIDGLYNKYQFAKTRKDFIKNYESFKKINPQGYPSWSVNLVKKELLDNLDEDIFIFSGIANETIYHCSEIKDYFESDQIYKSDRYGFNNPDFVYNEEIDIVLVGDSFVHSSCVSQDKGYAGNLRNLFDKKGIVSIGWRGAGPFKELGMLTEYALKLKPKYILWVYFEGNDYIEIVREQKYEILKNYLNESFSQNLIERQNEIKDISIKITNKNLKEHFKLNWHDKNVLLSYLTHRIKLWNLRWNFFYRKSHTPNKNEFQFKKFREIMSVAKLKAEKNGSELIFVYQPGMLRYEEKNIDHEKYLNKRKIIEIIKELSIPVIDIHEAFTKHVDPLQLWVAHTNEEGYKNAAEHIYIEMKAIIKNKNSNN